MGITVKLTTGHLEAAGAALCGAGRYGLGADFFRAAIASAPGDPDLLMGLNGALRHLKQFAEAETAILEAVAIDRTARRLVCLAATVRERGRKDESEDLLRQALELEPENVDALGCLGIWTLDRWRETSGSDDLIVEATALLERAVAIAPQNQSFQEGRLICYQVVGRYDDWARGCDELLKDEPGVYAFEMQQTFALMKSGDLRRGLPALARNIYRRPAVADCPLLRYPEWKPGDPPGPVVLWNAEGSGDWFQFARYARLAAAAGAEIRAISGRPEARLLARCSGVAQVVDPENVEVERHATIYSLARDFTTCEQEIPTEPYLSADPDSIEAWRVRLEPIPGFRVGVCWRGNPKQDNDPRRSFPAELFKPLVHVPGVNLVSLQKGHREELTDSHIWDLGDFYQDGDWLGTAAVIANLDLVISACTGVAHLAGAIGKPVWLALSEPGCWRWMTEREDSPWYPTMRIFRQTVRGSWDGVFERMAETLACYLSEAAAAPFPIRRLAEPPTVLTLSDPRRPLPAIRSGRRLAACH